LLRDGTGLPDGQLLEGYINRRDKAALAALVRRHGPMVWGVCRRVLANYHDAEDAFQATFLVLVRKAASIASRELLANWLYGVAHQTALRARATAARRKQRERPLGQMPEPATADYEIWRDLQPVLDAELSRLPDRYRAVIVLCDLEGKTRKEAARQLGVPEGTVAGRLARARTMLAKRLARRGLALPGGVLTAVLSQSVAAAHVPAWLVSSTIKATSLFAAGQGTAGLISAPVAALVEGVLKTMLLSRLKIAAPVVLVAVLACSAFGLLSFVVTAAPSGQTRKSAAGKKGKQNVFGHERFCVTIWPEKTRIKADETFEVKLRVVNSSAQTQTFQVMNCSWFEHWVCSNPRIAGSEWPCRKNFPVTVELQPGEAYERRYPCTFRRIARPTRSHFAWDLPQSARRKLTGAMRWLWR
jgi:RNA polymerase sigma factor (sigma-70 family)